MHGTPKPFPSTSPRDHRVPRTEFARDFLSPALQASQVISLQQMSDSDDDTSIPTLPTARKPGYSPPIDYVQYLDVGGELAKLISLKEPKSLKAAAMVGNWESLPKKQANVETRNGSRRSTV